MVLESLRAFKLTTYSYKPPVTDVSKPNKQYIYIYTQDVRLQGVNQLQLTNIYIYIYIYIYTVETLLSGLD
jgi:hypothetical protein